MFGFYSPATGLRRTMAQSPVARIDIRPTTAIGHILSSPSVDCDTTL